MGTDQSDEIFLHRVNRELADWEQARDAKAVRKLDELLSPDLLFRRADKSVVGKKEFMEALSGPSPFTKRESTNVDVVLRDERALATLIVTTTKEDGSVNRYRNIRWFARDGGRWRLEYWFNDNVADARHLSGCLARDSGRGRFGIATRSSKRILEWPNADTISILHKSRAQLVYVRSMM